MSRGIRTTSVVTLALAAWLASPVTRLAADEPPPEPMDGADGSVENEAEAEAEAEALVAPSWDEEADHPARLDRSTEARMESADPAPASTAPAGASRSGASTRQAAAGYRPFLVEFGGIAGLLYQQLTYRDDLYGFMRPYTLKNGRVFGGYVEAYPLAVAVGGLLGRLGIEGRYSQIATFNSSQSDGAEFPTSAREFIAGLRFRLLPPSLQARGMQVTAGLGGGHQRFRVESALALPGVDNVAAIPTRHYRFLRADIGGRFALDLGFYVSLHAGLRVVVDAGEIDSVYWFPRARRMGIESGLHVGYVLPKNIEIAVGFEAQRYFYDARPNPDPEADPPTRHVVGGILDRYVLADVRVGWRY